MEINKITEIHDKVYAYLTETLKESELRFTLRVRNRKERLNQGYWFRGDDNYLAFSFWKGDDWKNKTSNIFFAINGEGVSTLEFVSYDDEKKIKFFSEVAEAIGMIQKTRARTGDTFEHWVKNYKGNDYIASLDSFLKRDKKIIDAFINSNNMQSVFAPIDDAEFKTAKKKVDTERKKIKKDQRFRSDFEEVKSITLRRLSLENVSLFGTEQNIDFHKNLTCLIGLNGTGKTSLLRGLVLAFTGYEQNETMGITDTAILTSELVKLLHIDGEIDGKATYPTKGGFVQISYDIDTIHKQARLLLKEVMEKSIFTHYQLKGYSEEWVQNRLDSIRTRQALVNEWQQIEDAVKSGEYSNKVYLKAENGEPSVSDDSESDFRNITDDRYKSLFLAFPQLQGEVKGTEKLHDGKYPHVSDAMSMLNNQPDNRFGAFADWLRGLNSVANDKQAKGEKSPKERILLKKVFEVISDITDETISLHKIVVKESGKDTIWVKMGNESSPILFELVSQGYNNVFGWVGYFMKRLVEVTTGDEDFTQTPAIVLIDEIDTYLHPKWQTKILAVLVKTFPNVQFIVTTHSPYVVGSVPNDKIKIYICEKQENTIEIEEFEEFTPYGANIERLSDKIFGVKGRFVKEVQEKLEHLSAVINEGDLTSAKTYLADNFSDIDSNDPDLRRSKMLIRTKEILAK